MTESFEAWIGRTVIREDLVTARLAAEFTATLAPYLFTPASEQECPPGLHWGVAPATPASHELGEDGAEAKGISLPLVALPRRMWAGGMIETLRPLSVGGKIHRVSKVAEVSHRTGKSGPLCFISVDHDISCDGVLSIRERQNLVFRDNTWMNPLPAASVKPEGELVWRVDPTPALLFRFSAFTFNAHRIHYDLSHATKTEGYPGLVVHGPLQAALMLNQQSVLNGSVPRRFEYRCTAALIAGQPFHVASTGHHTIIVDANGIVTSEGNTFAQ